MGIEIGLYVHIPFCRSKCAYCDFASVAGREHLWRPYLDVLLAEIAAIPPLRPITLYVGGGTPTLWPAEYLPAVVEGVRSGGLPAGAEATVEANPGTVDEAKLAALRRAGYNRISLGVQSTQEANLRLLGRIHSYAEAGDAVRWARAAGFDNLSIDLISGLPGQTVAEWQTDLARALELESEHLSAYGLSLEEGTPLAAAVARGALPEPDADIWADMYLSTEEILAAAGYRHYEISNWASAPDALPPDPGAARQATRAPRDWVRRSGPAARLLTCGHNLIYWRNEPYLGLGSGAHSSLQGKRFARLADPAAYVAARPADRVSFMEEIGPSLEMAETAILGLRLVAGLERDRFRHRFGPDPVEWFREPLSWAQGHGLLEYDDYAVYLTQRGRLLSNEVFQRLLPTTEP